MMGRMHERAWAIIGSIGCVLALASEAHGQQTALTRDAAAARELQKPYTQAEAGVSILTLPTTKVCLTEPGTCTRGDITPQGYVWMLYRAGAQYAIGAGASYAPSIKTDTPQPIYPGLDRTHKRDYLMIDMTGRYYAVHSSWLEGWVGATVGGVVVYDHYDTKMANPSAPILGPSGVLASTEGLSMGIAAGLGWTFAANWSVEAGLRSAWWYLPSTRACAPTGDCATLVGNVAVFTLGIGVAYRIAL